jgi:hypothetical protein
MATRILFLSESYLEGVYFDYYRQAMVDGLASLGYDVFSLRTNLLKHDMVRGVHQQLADFKPDLIFSVNAAGLNTDILKEPLASLPLVVYFIDSYERINPDWQHVADDKTMCVLTGSDQYIDNFKHKFPHLQHQVSFATFGAVDIADVVKPMAQRTQDVFFVGTLFGSPKVVEDVSQLIQLSNADSRAILLDLLAQHDQQYRFKLLDDLYARGFSDTTLSPSLKKRLDTPGWLQCSIDDLLSNQKRLAALSALSQHNVAIYGEPQTNWISFSLIHSPDLLKCFKFCSITSQDQLMDHYSNAKIAINIQHHQAFNFGLSMRVFDIFSRGCLLLTDRLSVKPLTTIGFVEGEDFIAFDTPADLQAKVAYYLANPTQSDCITQAARHKVAQSHQLTHRLQTILQLAVKQSSFATTTHSQAAVPLHGRIVLPTYIKSLMSHKTSLLAIPPPSIPNRLFKCRTKLGKHHQLEIYISRK